MQPKKKVKLKKTTMKESEMFPGKMIPETAIRQGSYITSNKKMPSNVKVHSQKEVDMMKAKSKKK